MGVTCCPISLVGGGPICTLSRPMHGARHILSPIPRLDSNLATGHSRKQLSSPSIAPSHARWWNACEDGGEISMWLHTKGDKSRDQFNRPIGSEGCRCTDPTPLELCVTLNPMLGVWQVCAQASSQSHAMTAHAQIPTRLEYGTHGGNELGSGEMGYHDAIRMFSLNWHKLTRPC